MRTKRMDLNQYLPNTIWEALFMGVVFGVLLWSRTIFLLVWVLL